MKTSKKKQICFLKQKNQLPAIQIPPFNEARNPQKIVLDIKQSDFIKRLKKTKSIMIAQKYRKQKHALNPYHIDSRKRRSYESLNNKFINQSSSSPRKQENISCHYSEQIEKLVFPPVHSSAQICLNNSKKLKSKELRIQSLFEPVDIGACLIERTVNKKGYKISDALNERQQFQLLKQYSKRKKHMQTEREVYNYTEIQEKSESACSNQKKSTQFKSTKYKRFLKNLKLSTQSSIPKLFKQHQRLQQLIGWQNKQDQYVEHYINKENF